MNKRIKRRTKKYGFGKAQEILDYCIDYLTPRDFPKNKKELKLYGEMIEEIEFMINTT